MIWQRTRIAVLAGLVLASAALLARADDKADEKKDEKKGEKLEQPKEKPGTGTVMPGPGHPGPIAGDCGGCGPAYKTVWVTEYRRECYEATRTVYKTEYRQEAYTAYRTECVPETRTRTCTVYHRVPEWHEVVRQVCTYVPCCETRTVMEKHVVCKQVTEMRTKCVDRGHYECVEVPVKDWFAGFRKSSCCGCDCCEPCVRTRTKRVWVPCMVTECYPVCRTVRETVCVPKTVTVNVCKPVYKPVVEKVCTYKCVPECKTETFTVMVRRCVPYTATRCVAVCVPVCEKYMATRCVPVCVAKQVPCCESCAPSCCEAAPCCGRKRFSFGGFGGLFSRKGGCCEEHHECGCGCH